MDIKQSTAVQNLVFLMIDSADHLTGKTGLAGSLTVKLSKNGGTGVSPVGVISEVDASLMPGWYAVAGNATDSNALGSLALHATAAGADPTDMIFNIVGYDPQDSVRQGLTSLPNAAAQAAGGLYTRGTGAGQINQDSNGRIDTNLVAVANQTSKGSALGSAIDEITCTVFSNLVYLNSVSLSNFKLTSAITRATVLNNTNYKALIPNISTAYIRPALGVDFMISNSEFDGFSFTFDSNGGSEKVIFAGCTLRNCYARLHYARCYAQDTLFVDSILTTQLYIPGSAQSIIRNCQLGDLQESDELQVVCESGGELLVEGGRGSLIFNGTQNIGGFIRASGFQGDITINSGCYDIVTIKAGGGKVVNNSAVATVTYDGNPVLNGTTLIIPAKVGDNMGSVASVTADVGITQTAADKVWASTASFASTLKTNLAAAIWDELLSVSRTALSLGAKIKNWVLGSDSKILLSSDAQTGVTIPTVTAITNEVAANVAHWLTAVPNALQSGRVDAYIGSIVSTQITAIINAIWDEPTSGHSTPGTTGKALTDASSAGDPWSTALPDSYVAGTAGYILSHNLLAAQDVANALKLAPAAGSPATGSVYKLFADVQLQVYNGFEGTGTGFLTVLGDTNQIITGVTTLINRDIWATLVPGAYTSGMAGYILGHFVDSKLSDIKSSADAAARPADILFTPANKVRVDGSGNTQIDPSTIPAAIFGTQFMTSAIPGDTETFEEFLQRLNWSQVRPRNADLVSGNLWEFYYAVGADPQSGGVGSVRKRKLQTYNGSVPVVAATDIAKLFAVQTV